MNKKNTYVILITLTVLLHGIHSYGEIMKTPSMYKVILAGGSGTRLWPLSRKKRPKQLLPLGSEATLLDQAISRACMLTEKEYIWVSTTKEHEEAIRAVVGDRVGTIAVEPGARDTGPAILLNCFEIYEKDPEAIIVFLPADPFIPVKHYKKFAAFIEHAVDFATRNDKITLLGVEPFYPATGYGYIEYDADAAVAPYPVKEFREKPSLEVAQQYLEKGNMLWNISIFCAKASVFLEEFKKHAPEMYEGVSAYRKGLLPYSKVKAKSIDYAVMERSNNVHVLPVDFAWCDVGNIEVFLDIKKECNTLDCNYLAIDSTNNLVDVPQKMVALVGVDDLCVVETEDVLLVVKKGKAERVRGIVKQLNNSRFESYL